MTKQQNHLEQLREIRQLMERSSRFLSLSGLSGVIAGVAALLGATAVYLYLDRTPLVDGPYLAGAHIAGRSVEPLPFFLLVGGLVLATALLSGFWFTSRRARREGQTVWGPLSQRLLINLAIPLASGGVFILALYRQGLVEWIAPATLLFYGMALLNASKFTFTDIRYLGLSEIALGLLASFFLGYGLEFWTIGFGLLHIAYGAWMWNKYERTDTKLPANNT
jgi:hypothetical protein